MLLAAGNDGGSSRRYTRYLSLHSCFAAYLLVYGRQQRKQQKTQEKKTQIRFVQCVIFVVRVGRIWGWDGGGFIRNLLLLLTTQTKTRNSNLTRQPHLNGSQDNQGATKLCDSWCLFFFLLFRRVLEVINTKHSWTLVSCGRQFARGCGKSVKKNQIKYTNRLHI